MDSTWFARWEISLLLIATLSATPTKYYCFLTTQQLLRLLLTSTPFSIFCRLLLPTPVSYFYHLLLTSSRYYSLLYQLFLLTSHFSYYFQVLLSDNIITYSYQLLLSAIPIRYFYQLLVSTLLAYSYKVLSELLCN